MKTQKQRKTTQQKHIKHTTKTKIIAFTASEHYLLFAHDISASTGLAYMRVCVVQVSALVTALREAAQPPPVADDGQTEITFRDKVAHAATKFLPFLVC